MSNNITVQGNLTREPELRFTAAGRGVCNLGIASSRRYQKDGEWVEETSFFNLVVWGELGENAASSFTKGMRVLVQGRVESRQYETAEGDKRTAIEIVVDDIAASVRWATVEVTKTERTHANAGATARANQSAPVYGDEEPF